MAGSNRKNLAKQIGIEIPKEARMILHSVVRAPGRSDCVSCYRSIEKGQSVRWCEVDGYVPAGYIHAHHFDSGPAANPRSKGARTGRHSKRSVVCRRHQWGPWTRAGIFDSTEIRRCRECLATKSRKPIEEDLRSDVRSVDDEC
jgi:hypothetical protein